MSEKQTSKIMWFLLGVVITSAILTPISIALHLRCQTQIAQDKPQLSEEELTIQNELDYNSTHGYVVRVEKSDHTAITWDYDINDAIEVRDYAYAVNLLDGTAYLDVEYNSRLQRYFVGDFVEVDDYGITKLAKANPEED